MLIWGLHRLESWQLAMCPRDVQPPRLLEGSLVPSPACSKACWCLGLLALRLDGVQVCLLQALLMSGLACRLACWLQGLLLPRSAFSSVPLPFPQKRVSLSDADFGFEFRLRCQAGRLCMFIAAGCLQFSELPSLRSAAAVDRTRQQDKPTSPTRPSNRLQDTLARRPLMR